MDIERKTTTPKQATNQQTKKKQTKKRWKPWQQAEQIAHVKLLLKRENFDSCWFTADGTFISVSAVPYTAEVSRDRAR